MEMERVMPKLNMEIPIMSVQQSTQRNLVPLKQNQSPLYCSICQVQTFTKKDFANHMKSLDHLSTENKITNVATQAKVSKSSKYVCQDCVLVFNSEDQYVSHMNSRDHYYVAFRSS